VIEYAVMFLGRSLSIAAQFRCARRPARTGRAGGTGPRAVRRD
jgi:hypothetical protein